MIPCPNCGTHNRRGSRYCYHCGQRLDIVFDVSCPACDRLNPGGSAFCAFCGAKIVGSPPVGEEPARMVHEPSPSESKSARPPPRPERELPPWLYEQPVQHPQVGAPLPHAAGEPQLGQSKYLRDIPGALPQTEGWLSSALKPGGRPVADQAPQSKPKARGGCLALPLLALGAAGILVISAL
jgi:hypothetical protein